MSTKYRQLSRRSRLACSDCFESLRPGAHLFRRQDCGRLLQVRNKIGTEVAVEALKDYLKKYRRGADALWGFAKICRVANVMRPYLEAAG